MYQPPILPEDTQPRPPSWEDTQPSPVVLRQRWWQQRGRWILMAVIGTTLLSLGLTVSVLLRPPNTPQTVMEISNPTIKTVTLSIAGDVQTIQTTASTIAEVLSENQIDIPTDDTVSPAVTDPITEGMTITINRTRDVTLTINGETQTLKTPFDNPLDILESAGIILAPNDEVRVDGTLATLETLPVWTVPATTIDIRTALDVTIIDDGVTTAIRTYAKTVESALFEAEITLYLTDIISPALDTPITQDMRITIDRAIPIELVVDGVTVSARTNASSVADVLSEMNSPLFGLDYVKPDRLTPVTEGMTIEIVRVTEEVISSSETIPYEVVYQSSADMNLDERAVIQAGQNGTVETSTRIRYENGIEVSRSDESSVITQNPTNEIIAYGTNIVLQTVDTPEGARQYWRTFRVYATSYHPAALGGDNITAIGATLQKGIIGADPKIIPWRTEMYVPGYGVGMMADTGGPRSSPYWIDLGYSDEDWVAWYHYVDVYLLTPIPDEINYLLPTWTAIR